MAAAKFDPNIELSPNAILIAVAILVIAAFAIVRMITMEDASRAAAPPVTAPQ